MAITPISGMQGVNDFVTNERPENWRAGLLRQQPAGQSPLTALTALMPSRKVDDFTYNWWTKSLQDKRVALAAAGDIYTGAALSVKLGGGGYAANQLAFVKIADNDAKQIRSGHQVALRNSDDETMVVSAKVIGEPVLNGASSYVPIQLLEADDNSIASPANRINTTTHMRIIGNINPQGGLRPKAIAYAPTQLFSYTQIFRTALNLTRTRMQTRSRTGDPYQEAKRDAMLDNMLEQELAYLWGERTLTTNAENGQPETTTRGIVSWIRAEASENIKAFNLETDSFFLGKKFKDVGWTWLRQQMELSFRYTSPGSNGTKLVYAGTLALLHLQEAIEAAGAGYFLRDGQMEFGIKVQRLVSPFGEWYIQTHPLFSHSAEDQYSMLVLEPANLGWAYIQDTIFIPQANKEQFCGEGGKDGIDEEFKTEGGLEMYYANTFMQLNGIGKDNTATGD